MSGKDEYIIVTDSHNFDDDTVVDTREAFLSDGKEMKDVSLRDLRNQGISIEQHNEMPESTESLDELAQELLSGSGIEIMPSERDSV